MKRFRPSLRRLAAFAAAAFAGAAATLFIATPAFAHHPTPTGVAHCDLVKGGWYVDWTVGSSPNQNEFQITAIQARHGVTDAAIAGSFSGELGSLATGFKLITQTFSGTQSYSNSVPSVWLEVTGLWKKTTVTPATLHGPHTNTKTADGVVVVQKPPCAAAPVATFKDNCDGTVTVTLDNQQGTQPVEFSITGSPNKTVPGGQKLDVTVAGNAKITVLPLGMDGSWEHTWAQPRTCGTPTPSPTTPVTGASVTGTIGIGAGLVLGGAALIALVFLMRRRRTVAGH